MAESHQKRPREEPETPEPADSKRQSLTQLQSTNESSLLEPTNQQLDFSSATVELSAFDFDFLPVAEEETEQIHRDNTTAECSSSDEDEGGGVNSVMRHLLEASDDELGIPSNGSAEEENSCGENENLGYKFGKEGLWEFEDVVADYCSYVMLQSGLFM